MRYNNAIKYAGTYGLCIGVIFGTAASYFGKSSHQTYVNIMSKYVTGSAVSIVALLSLREYYIMPSSKSKQQRPLQHLKVLSNHQSFSMSSIPSTLPLNIHSRF